MRIIFCCSIEGVRTEYAMTVVVSGSKAEDGPSRLFSECFILAVYTNKLSIIRLLGAYPDTAVVPVFSALAGWKCWRLSSLGGRFPFTNPSHNLYRWAISLGTGEERASIRLEFP